MENIFIELPKEVSAAIKTKAHDQVAELHETLKTLTAGNQIKVLKDLLFQEKRNHQSAIYFKDKRIEQLTKIIQDKSNPNR